MVNDGRFETLEVDGLVVSGKCQGCGELITGNLNLSLSVRNDEAILVMRVAVGDALHGLGLVKLMNLPVELAKHNCITGETLP